jgi:hypothetical protein
MKRAVVAISVLAMSAPLGAQWLKYPTPGMPRTSDGKPNVTAPAPRTADGKPDLSGIWQIDGFGYAFNITGDQKPEMLPWAQTLYKERAAGYGKDGPDQNCLPPGPRAGLFSQALLKTVQTPGLLLILYEEAPTRQIFTDGRKLPTDPNPTWMGYSIGRWDGDTLVVESAGFNDKTWLDFTGHPHTEALHVTERYRRKDFGHMQLEMTFDDPKAYTKPWTIAVAVNFVPDTDLLEYVCNENERDHGHLIGKVQDEKKSETTVSREILSKYAGTYRAGPLGNFRVSVEADQLMIELPGGGGRQPTFAQSDSHFVFPAIGGVVEFVKDSQGTVTHLLLKVVEGDQRAVRVNEGR